MTKELIVNADDYGHTPGVSQGIREAHLHGIVTSTTAMMNMTSVGNDLEIAIRECPRLGIGVHLVLTTGRPLLDSSEVSSLLNSMGEFQNEDELAAKILTIDSKQARNEWKKQIEKFISITGRKPDHLDSHHHAAYFSSELCRISLELAQEYECAIRFPTKEVGADILGDFPPDYARICGEKNQELIKKFSVAHPDFFLRSFYGENSKLEILMDVLSNLSEGSTEMMCHPGYPDKELFGSSTYIIQRQMELEILTNKDVLSYINDRQVKLINFGDLSKS